MSLQRYSKLISKAVQKDSLSKIISGECVTTIFLILENIKSKILPLQFLTILCFIRELLKRRFVKEKGQHFVFLQPDKNQK